MNKYQLLLFSFFICYIKLDAQVSFQKQFQQIDIDAALQTYDAKQATDGGYVFTGHASEANDLTKFHPYIIKLNCKGQVEWQHYFGLTQSTANINSKIIITQDSGFVVTNNIGSYSNYNGLVVRLDKNGTILWQKKLNLSSGNDILSDIIETSTGEFVLTGSAKNTTDVALVKLSSNGNLIWSKAIGKNGNYDDGYALIETYDGNYLLTGRYISMGTFNAFLMKTDTSGVVQWLKCYGDTLQHMNGYAVKEMSNGDLILAGSTTLLKPNYQSFSDNFVMRLNNVGDTIWTKIFYGSPYDSYENVSSIEFDKNENIILGVATSSYYTPGNIPNKYGLMKFSPQGNLLLAKTYNNGSSNYARISTTNDGTMLMSGFTNLYTNPIGFQTLLLKLDSNYASGCFDNNVLAQTIVSSTTFKITNPGFLTTSTGSVTIDSSIWFTQISDTTFCASYPLLNPVISYQNTCVTSPINFSLDTSLYTYWHWDFGDNSTMADTSLLANASYQYALAGIYTVQLIVSNGCDWDTSYKSIFITNPVTNYSIGADTLICQGDSIMLNSTVGNFTYLWNTGDTTNSIYVKTAGNYYCTISTSCGNVADTMKLTTKVCPPDAVNNFIKTDCNVILPTAFSPNGDGHNDVLKPIIVGNQNQDFKFEQMQIINRWGNVIFTTNDAKIGWDGTYKGTMQPAENYFYFVRYRCNGKEKIMKGNVVIVR